MNSCRICQASIGRGQICAACETKSDPDVDARSTRVQLTYSGEGQIVGFTLDGRIYDAEFRGLVKDAKPGGDWVMLEDVE